MSVPEFLTHAVGSWAAQNKLMMHGEADRSSASKLTIAPAVMGQFMLLCYTWSFDGEAHEGVLLLGGNKDAAFASWADSFHTCGGIMPLKGSSAPGKVTLLGSYSAPPGPDWGWRFEISDAGGAIRFAMTNISPEGQEEPAVEAVYRRA